MMKAGPPLMEECIIAAPLALLSDIIRVCTDPITACIMDIVLHMLCHVSRIPSG